MAWRIHTSVLRGVVDNRIKGVVTGKIWMLGSDEPIVLSLQGNANPDLAGSILEFTNPTPKSCRPSTWSLSREQVGATGDLTASRKVRVFDIPLEEALEMLKRGEKPPDRIVNCLYLEWYSHANGRVVIESPSYELTLSNFEWRLTPEEERQRIEDSARGFMESMRRMLG